MKQKIMLLLISLVFFLSASIASASSCEYLNGGSCRGASSGETGCQSAINEDKFCQYTICVGNVLIFQPFPYAMPQLVTVSPQFGTLLFDSSGSGFWIYIPNVLTPATDEIQITYLQSTAFITISIIDPASLQTINPTGNTMQNTPFTGNIAVQGGSGNFLFNLLTSPTNGSLLGLPPINPITGQFTYQPNLNFVGLDGFGYTVTDIGGCGCNNTASGQIEIVVGPEAIFDHVIVTCANTTITKQILFDTSVNTFSITSQPTHGQITNIQINPTNVTYSYTPNLNYNGPDSFSFVINGPDSSSTMGTVSIEVLKPLFANNISITGCTGSPIAGFFSATGGSGFYTNYNIATSPAHGSASYVFSSSSPAFTYTSTIGYIGPDNFMYTVTDSNGCISNNTGSVNISVLPKPVGIPYSLSGCSGAGVNGQLSGTGGIGGYTFAIQNQGIYPELTFFNPANGMFTWNFINTSPATFNFTVQDSSGCISSLTAAQMIPLAVPHVNSIAFSVCQNGSHNGVLAATGSVGPYNYTYIGPFHGSFNIFDQLDGSYSYTPNIGYIGGDALSYQAIDISTGCKSNSAGIIITVDATIAPSVTNFSEIGCLNGVITGNISAVGGVPPYAFNFFNGPTHGILSVFNPVTGQFVYQPNVNYSGPDSFNYAAIDTNNCPSNVGTVQLTVNSSSAPVATPTTLTNCQNSGVQGSFNVTGGSGTYVNYTIITPPTNGVISNINVTAGTYFYTSFQGFFGSDSFTYVAVDSNGCTSNLGLVNITTLSTLSPIAQNSSLTVCENGSVNGLFNPTGFIGAFNILTLPTNGTVSHNGTSQNFAYTPNTGYIGPDSFTFTVSDGSCLSSPGTINITVISSLAPTILPLSLAACQDGIVTAPTNPVGGTSPYLSFIQVMPTNGTALGSGAFSSNPTVTYIPNSGYVGPDSFVYQIQDSGQCISVTGLASINVLSTLSPVVQPLSLVSCQGNAVNGVLIASQGTAPYNFTYMSGPLHGTITSFNSTTGQFAYQPNVGYSGPDGFTYSATDSTLSGPCQSFTANVGIIVDPNLILNPLSVGLCMDGVKQSQLMASGGIPSYSFTSLGGPSHGSFTQFDQSTGQFIYKPATNYSGPDSFIAKVTDQVGCSNTGVIGIIVNPEIITAPFSLTACSGGSVLGTFQATGGNGSYTFAFSSPAHGFITPVGSNQFVYTPVSGFVGTDSFTYTATQNILGGCTSDPQTVTINVTSSIAPSVQPISLAMCFNNTASGNLTGSGGIPPYMFSFFNGPSHGTLIPFNSASGAFIYNPVPGFSGQDMFSYEVTDAAGCTSVPMNAILTVNSPLAVSSISLITCMNSCKQGSFSATGGTGNYVFNFTSGGTLQGEVFLDGGNTFTYCPPISGFTGVDSFNYYAVDTLNCSGLDCRSSLGTVNVTVEFSAPVATPYTLTTCLNGSVTATFSATGGSGNYSFSNTLPNNGTLTFGNNNSFTYQPVPAFVGTDSFTYTATDLVTGCTSSMTLVTITINSTPAPVALSLGITGCPGGNITGAYSPTGGSGTYIEFDLISGPTHGTVNPTSSSSSSFMYMANSITYLGSDVFTYTVQDSNGCVSSPGTVGVVTDQLTANDLTIDVSVNASGSGSLNGSSGIGSLNYTVSPISIAGGTIVLTSGPTSPEFTYTPPLNFTGNDAFTYVVTDSFCTSNTGTVTVDVTTLTANNVSALSCENNFFEAIFAESTPGGIVFVVIKSGMTSPIQIVLGGTGGSGCYEYNVPSSSVNGGSINQPYGNCAPYIIYTAPSGFVGTDSFTYTITDAQDITSSPATVTIQIVSRPTAPNLSLQGCSDSIINGTFMSSGGAGGFIYSLTGSGPAHGVVELIVGSSQFQYSSTAGFFGTDGFNYEVTDANGCMSTGSVTITVNQQPIANPVVISVCMNTQALSNFLPSGGVFPYVFNAPSFSDQGGVITQPGGTGSSGFTYIPRINYKGSDSFTYTVTDSNGCTSDPGLVSINVDAARAVSLSLVGCENASISSALVGIGGIGSYNFTYLNGPFHGTLNPFNSTTGQFTYNPTAGYTGPDSFLYTVTDQGGIGCVSNTAEVDITIDGVSALDENFTICVGGSVSGTLQGQGGIGALTYAKVGPGPVPGNQLIFNPAGSFVYNPTAGFVGTDGFFYVVMDSIGCSSPIFPSPAHVVINVEQPTAEDVAFHACADATTSGTLNGSGGIGNYVYFVPQFSQQGGAIVNNGTADFSYTPPTPSYMGPDSFDYTVLDSLFCISPSGTVSITVGSTIANDIVLTGCPNKEVVGQLTATGGSGIFEVTSGPDRGIFTAFCAETGVFVYMPGINFVGTDTFTYVVVDSNNCVSSTGTVFIFIQAPIAAPLNFTVCPNGSSNIDLSLGVTGGTGTYTSYAIVAGPERGSITPVNPPAGQFLYTPFLGYVGPDSFLYTVTDSAGCVSNPGDVSIFSSQVIGINSNFIDCVDTLLTGQALATGGTGIYTFGPIVIPPPSGATASITGNGSFTYQPVLGFTGSDSFSYQMTDSNGCTSLGTIFVLVGNPAGVNQNITGCSNVATTGFLSAIGGNGNYIFSISGPGPSHGTAILISPTAGTFVYNPTTGYVGPDSFQFGVSDSAACTGATGAISINIISNATATPASFVTCQNVFLQGSVNPTGGSGTFIAYIVVTPPAHGTLLSFCPSSGVFTYLPNTNFTGVDMFTYAVRDTNLCTSPSGMVTITVNSSPIALPVIEILCAGASVTDDLNPTGGTGTYVLYTVPTTSIEGGTISQPLGNTSPEFTYIAPTGLSGIDSFNYSVLDTNGCQSECGAVAIEVNSGPIGLGVAVTDNAGQTVSGQLQAIGGEPPYTFAIATLPTQGIASVSTSGAWTYTAFQTASGFDFFTYTVTDASGCVTTRKMGTRAPVPNDTVLITIIGSGYPFDIIPDACPL